MNIEEDIFIERFLRKQLSNKEEKSFLERLDTDAVFYEKFVFEKQLFQTLNEDEWSVVENSNQKEIESYKELYNNDKSKTLKKVLKNVNSNYQKNIKKKSVKKLLYYISAAVFATLITIFSLSNFKNSPEDLYTNYFNKLNLTSLVTRGVTNNELAKAQQYFEEKKYNKALPIFKSALQNTNTQKATLYLYTGVSLTELNKYEEAIQIFDELISSNLLEASKGLWFKALLYLKMNDIENAKITLLKITKENEKYNQAQELIDKLSKLK